MMKVNILVGAKCLVLACSKFDVVLICVRCHSSEMGPVQGKSPTES
jgi:hypothetical protein